MKDWTGNKASSHSMLGSRNLATNGDREENDYYATHPDAINLLFQQEEFDKNIWECACGEGHLSKRMTELSKNVYSTDLIDRGFGDGQIDFLITEQSFDGDIITNPPYKFGIEFVEQAMKLTKNKVAFFCNINFLTSKGRKKLFEKYPMKVVYVFSGRMQCLKNGDMSLYGKQNAVNYAWFVWEKGFVGSPIIKWI